MNIPSKKTCFHLMDKMEMPSHITVHSCVVSRVASFLAKYLKSCKINLNIELVQASALLHDLTKSRSFKTGENHAHTGGQVLSDLGYPGVGEIVRQHVVLDTYFTSDLPTEAEVVNYADKRVLHDRVVSLAERKSYILQKYATNPTQRERILVLWRKLEEMENRIFSFMPFPPEDLPLLNESEDYPDEFSVSETS